jgi:hypothetical protein
MVVSREELNAKRQRNYAISQRKKQKMSVRIAANRKRAERREAAACDAKRRR